jgi:hypothetical protein
LSVKDKLIKKLKSKPKDFTWDELCKLFSNLEFTQISNGKTAGSRRKFFHANSNLIINLHKPHPNSIIKSYLIEQILKKLEEEKLI